MDRLPYPLPGKRALVSRSLLLSLAAATLAGASFAGEQLLVSGFSSNSVTLYDGGSGSFIRKLATLRGPQAMVDGPDGNLYVVEENRDKIVRFDGMTGARLADFVFDDPDTGPDETGGLDGPTGMGFGADGHLYVASFNNSRVLRYHGTTGAFLGTFVATGSGSLSGPDTGTTFGPDGNLYVPSFNNNRVLRYDGTTGAFIDAFIPGQTGGLLRPRSLVFRDGFLYVASEGSHQVLRYDAVTGAFDSVFVDVNVGGLFSPTGMEFGSDGNLYVVSLFRNSVLRYDGTTGAFIDVFVAERSGGISAPTFLHFIPEFRLRMTATNPPQVGEDLELVVSGATPDDAVLFGFGTVAGDLPVPRCPGVLYGIADARRGGRDRVEPDGTARLVGRIPARLSGRTFLVQAVELSTCRVSELVELVIP